MFSKATCSFRAKASIGTLRDAGITATVLRFVLLCPSSEMTFLDCAFDEESTSSRTREAIIRSSLGNIRMRCRATMLPTYCAVVCGFLLSKHVNTNQIHGLAVKKYPNLEDIALKSVCGIRISSVSRIACTVVLRGELVITSSSPTVSP